MILKKLIMGLFCFCFLTSCAQNVALLGPTYTLANTGNIYQAGLTYGTNVAITKVTGKSTSQNIKEVLTPKEEDTELQKLVKRNIEETRKKLKLSNQ